MKIQDLAIVFIIIILPISLVLSMYTQYQVQTINTQTLYDAKLTSATYDAVKAFQLNTTNNKLSDLTNSKIRDLEASVATFKNSIMSTFSLNGYTEEDLNSYIPALLYTLYDGFYLYSPYTNINHRVDEDGVNVDGNGENLYGLKPYIPYSCRYVKGNIDVVITYALDNHIKVQGLLNGKYINKEGYLIDNIQEFNGTIKYNGVKIEKEHLKEYVPIVDKNGNVPETYSYAKMNGVTYYLDESNKRIVARLNENSLTVQCEEQKEPDRYRTIKEFITSNNSLAQDYYKEAMEFTEWFSTSGLQEIKYSDAIDTIIDGEGNVITGSKVWENDEREIFQFNGSPTDFSKNIENESSSFNQHRLDVIRHKIEVNLAIAIANYNNFSGADNVFEMPELQEDEWDDIIHNISLISFLQGLPIGGKLYNGYSIVTDSESEEVVLEQNIYILGQDQDNASMQYCKIGDRGLKNEGNIRVNAGVYSASANNYISAGRANLSFKRDVLANGDRTVYYYPLNKYNASYNSVVMQDDMDTFDDIYTYVNTQSTELKTAFYTALGRERASKYKKWSDYVP